MELNQILQTKKCVICVGSGGVGKTTISAVLGMKQAIEGKKVLVCTIDPAKRLANSLGLSLIGSSVVRVPDNKIKETTGFEVKGELWAMMLDIKSSWDKMIDKYAPSRERRDQIYENKFYKYLSSSLAGSHEYVALEKLYELRTECDYDLIVLDTPPTSNALQFLDAPNRIIDTLGNETINKLLQPYMKAGNYGLKFFTLGASYVVKVLGRFTGFEMIEELAKFLGHFKGMYDGIKERAAAVKDMIRQDDTTFIMVNSPSRMTYEESIFFYRELLEVDIPFSGFIVNRVRISYLDRLKKEFKNKKITATAFNTYLKNKYSKTLPAEILWKKDMEPVIKQIYNGMSNYDKLAVVDKEIISEIRQEINSECFIETVPEMDVSILDVSGLFLILTSLFPYIK